MGGGDNGLRRRVKTEEGEDGRRLDDVRRAKKQGRRRRTKVRRKRKEKRRRIRWWSLLTDCRSRSGQSISAGA